MKNKKTIVSRKWHIQFRDIIRGVLISALTSAFVMIQQYLDAANFLINWKQIAMASLAGGVSYIIKNWLIEPSKEITIIKK